MPETYTLVDADGTSWDLQSDTYFVTPGIIGRGLPPVDLYADKVPGEDGERPRDTQYAVRDVTVPLLVGGVDRPDVRRRIVRLARAIAPHRGYVSLVITFDDGTTRRLWALYSEGLEVDEAEIGGHAFHTAHLLPLVLRAHDPWWYGPTQERTWQPGAPVPFFPLLPLQLSPSSVLGDVTVTNGGDVPTWPLWTIVGPASGLALTSLTTGEQLVFIGSVAAGEVITVDPRPGRKTITSSTRGNIFGQVDWTVSTLWALPVGDTTVTVGMTDADSSVGSRVTLSWAEAFGAV